MLNQSLVDILPILKVPWLSRALASFLQCCNNLLGSTYLHFRLCHKGCSVRTLWSQNLATLSQECFSHLLFHYTWEKRYDNTLVESIHCCGVYAIMALSLQNLSTLIVQLLTVHICHLYIFRSSINYVSIYGRVQKKKLFLSL